MKDLQAKAEKIESISSIDSMTVKIFKTLKENKDLDKVQAYFDKNKDFATKFSAMIETELVKQNRVLMTFKNLNEMNDFIKAGNKLGQWYYGEADEIKAYWYK